MKLAVMQPYFFPYIGYFQLINAVDLFVIYDDVNYINRGYINRNSILIEGKPHRFTLELHGASQNKLINEIEIGGKQAKIIKTIEMAYKKAPFFDVVIDTIKKIILCEENNLAKYIGNSLIEMSAYFELKTNFIYSSEIEKDNSLRGQDKILAICKKLGAATYINAIGGQALYRKDDFENEGVGLEFIKTENLEYKQSGNSFVPNLSIIDILMFNSLAEVRNMLCGYRLTG